MPSAYFLPSHYQWAIAHVFSSRKFRTAADFPLQTIEDLHKIVPPDCWKYAADWEGQLLEFVHQDVDSILAEAAALKAKNDTWPPDSTTSSQDMDSIEGVTAEEWQAQVVERQTRLDNETALLVSVQRKKIWQNHNILVKGSQTPPVDRSEEHTSE